MQAADFVKWADLKEGQHVLDLCCGTGLVALLAKEKVGPQGHVIGLDISQQMMNEGRRKAVEAGLDVTFIKGDVSTFRQGDLLFSSGRGFDLITCASGLALLDNPGSALKHWGAFLASDGKLIVDVPAQEAMLGASIMEQLLKDAGFSPGLIYGMTSMNTLEQFVLSAGLRPVNIFETQSYSTSEIDVADIGGHFDMMLKYFEVGDSIDEPIKGKLKGEFQQRLSGLANSAGKINRDPKFYIAIATTESVSGRQ